MQIFFFLTWLLLITSSLAAAPLQLQTAAESAILINADTGAVLYEKNAKKKLFPASITKIATCLYVLQVKGDKFDEVLVAEQDCVGSVTEEEKIRSQYKLPSHWLVKDSSHIGIKRGEKMRIEDLLYGMMLASADDASNVLAYHIGGSSIPHFMEELNVFLQKLGCKDTYFNNPHGLQHPDHVTTARDMAILTREALKNDQFRKIVSTVRCTRPKTNMQEPTTLLQTNKLLRKGDCYYSKAIGVKTGWHSKAGSTLVAAAKDGDRTLIAVLMNVKDRKELFKDTARLFEAAFKQPKMQKVVVKAGPQKFAAKIKEVDHPVKTFVEKDIAIAFYPAEEPALKAYVEWHEKELPVKKGDQLGVLIVKSNLGEIIGERAILSDEDIEKGFSHYFSNHKNYYSIAAILAVLLGFYFLFRYIRRS